MDVGRGVEGMEDDPFELMSIIEAVMDKSKGRKQPIHEVEYAESGEVCEPPKESTKTSTST